jgi:TetR/AcrR family transcriptional regulator, transcriptional repressor for nem operon
MSAPTAKAASILDAAELMIQAIGYNGLSFRDLAAAVGIKSASVHYHFPSKSHLGAAVARRYTDRLIQHLEQLDARVGDPNGTLAGYIAVFRTTLEQDGRMCLCGILAAETDAIPTEVQAEVRRFVDLNVRWISSAIERTTGARLTSEAVNDQAKAIFAALEGAMLVARGTGNVTTYDVIVAEFVRSGLIPR